MLSDLSFFEGIWVGACKQKLRGKKQKVKWFMRVRGLFTPRTMNDYNYNNKSLLLVVIMNDNVNSNACHCIV